MFDRRAISARPSGSKIDPQLAEIYRRTLPGALGVYTKNGYRVQLGEYFWGYIEAGKEGTSRGSQVAEWVRRQAEEERGNTPETHIGTAICGMPGGFLGPGEHENMREWPLTITEAPEVVSGGCDYTRQHRGRDGRFAVNSAADRNSTTVHLNEMAAETLGSLVADNGFGVHITANYASGLTNDVNSDPGDSVTLQGLNFETVKSLANLVEDLTPEQRIVGQPAIFIEGYQWADPYAPPSMKTVATFRTIQPPETVPRQLDRKDRRNHFRLFQSSYPAQQIADRLNAEFQQLSTPEAAPDGRGFITLQYYATPPLLSAEQQEEGSPLNKDQQLYNAWATFLNWMNDHPDVGIEEAYLTITDDTFNTFVKDGAAAGGGEDWRVYRLVVRFKDNSPDHRYSRKTNSPYPLDEGYEQASVRWPDMRKYIMRLRKLSEPLRDGWTTTDGFGIAMLEGILPIVDNISITQHQRNIDRWFTNWLYDHPSYEIVQCVPGGTTGVMTLKQGGRGPYFPAWTAIQGFRQQMPVFFIDRDIADKRKKAKDEILLPVDVDADTMEVKRAKRFRRANGCLEANLDDMLLYGDLIPKLHREDFQKPAEGHFAGDIGVAGFLGVYASEGDNFAPPPQQFCFMASVIDQFERNNWGYLDSSWLLNFDSHHYSFAKGKSFGNTLETFLFRLITRVYRISPARPNRTLKTQTPPAPPHEAGAAPADATPDVPALDGVTIAPPDGAGREEGGPEHDDGDDMSSWGDHDFSWGDRKLSWD